MTGNDAFFGVILCVHARIFYQKFDNLVKHLLDDDTILQALLILFPSVFIGNELIVDDKLIKTSSKKSLNH